MLNTTVWLLYLHRFKIGEHEVLVPLLSEDRLFLLAQTGLHHLQQVSLLAQALNLRLRGHNIIHISLHSPGDEHGFYMDSKFTLTPRY